MGTEKSAPATKEEFASRLEEKIIRGKLAPGTKLPTERDFEMQTGLGKTAIHGALRELEHRGFIRIAPRKGAYVADFARTGTADTLSEVLRCNGGRLTFKMSTEIVELRNAIEGAAFVRLAAHHTDEDIDKMREALDKLRSSAVRDMEIPEIAELEKQFHYLIIDLAGNDMFSLVMNSFDEISVAVWQCCCLYWGVEGFIAHDSAIIDMIERGEGREAQLYIESVYDQFLKAFYLNSENG